jgi:hypothetical protein
VAGGCGGEQVQYSTILNTVLYCYSTSQFRFRTRSRCTARPENDPGSSPEHASICIRQRNPKTRLEAVDMTDSFGSSKSYSISSFRIQRKKTNGLDLDLDEAVQFSSRISRIHLYSKDTLSTVKLLHVVLPTYLGPSDLWASGSKRTAVLSKKHPE